jgi:hypothetical protein
MEPPMSPNDDMLKDSRLYAMRKLLALHDAPQPTLYERIVNMVLRYFPIVRIG